MWRVTYKGDIKDINVVCKTGIGKLHIALFQKEPHWSLDKDSFGNPHWSPDSSDGKKHWYVGFFTNGN